MSGKIQWRCYCDFMIVADPLDAVSPTEDPEAGHAAIPTPNVTDGHSVYSVGQIGWTLDSNLERVPVVLLTLVDDGNITGSLVVPLGEFQQCFGPVPF